MTHRDLREGLALVIQRGAPAQQEQALRLAAALDQDPADADAWAAAGQLVDAYLNDPYLERG